MRLAGKVAIVTGAASGIGRATAVIALSSEGPTVGAALSIVMLLRGEAVLQEAPRNPGKRYLLTRTCFCSSECGRGSAARHGRNFIASISWLNNAAAFVFFADQAAEGDREKVALSANVMGAAFCENMPSSP